MKAGSLRDYHEKRDFEHTAEPRGGVEKKRTAKSLSFVVQRHHASHLHYDFRLELDGVLKSWAVPKGPSLVPGETRLAVEVEDHPLDYGTFEGSIPKGEYGGGWVLVWDHGTWVPEGDPHEGLRRGNLKLTLHGDRLEGGFVLVRLRGKPGETKHNWLLLKHRDAGAKTKRDLAQITEVAEAESPPSLDDFSPQLATLRKELPMGAELGYELKLDGYRALAKLDEKLVGKLHEKLEIRSRNQQRWTDRFPEIAAALKKLDVENAVFDGEICAIDDQGRTSFQALQDALSHGHTKNLVYFIFDLLFVDGFDLRDRPLAVRKAILESILEDVKLPLSFVRHLEGAKEAKAVLAEGCRRGLEGIVVKRLDRPHHAGRTPEWVKVKCKNEQEFVIVGYTKPKGQRGGLGALLLGARDGGKLRYVGKVGTGFSQETRASLTKILKNKVIDVPSVTEPPRMRDVVWVEPDVVCKVAYGEKTRDGMLRHPSFVGLREVAITHPERVVDEVSGVTKDELARHHERVADRMLPHATKRPLALVRCPEGVGGKSFFQKKKAPGMSAAIHASRAAGHDVLYVDDVEGLVSLVQFGALELHAWGSRLPTTTKPDVMVIDLDPDEALPFSKVIQAAKDVREIFVSLGLESFVKTTGGKGLHVVAPFAPEHSWNAVKSLAHSIAMHLQKSDPTRFTATMSKSARHGKIFVDYLRNGEGATAILPYATRNRPGLPVATPISWRELEDVDPRVFTVKTVAKRIAGRKRDPWASFFTVDQHLPSALEGLGGGGES